MEDAPGNEAHIVLTESGLTPAAENLKLLPDLILNAGASARFAYEEFFHADIANPATRRAYRHAVNRFLHCCASRGMALRQVTPAAVGDYLEALKTKRGELASKPTRKLHLAALRHFFDRLVLRHAVALNPAASVRGPKHSVVEGRTAALSVQQARHVLATIDSYSLIGSRDRAIIAVLIYTAVRVGAVAKLRRRDFFTDGRQWLFRFDEKNGKERVIPARHDLEGFVKAYLALAGDAELSAPLFCSLRRGVIEPRVHRVTAGDILRMVKRRLRRAHLPDGVLSCHSFRATTITNLLEQGVPLEDVQYLAGHADPRTTRLYDRRHREVTRNIVERIAI